MALIFVGPQPGSPHIAHPGGQLTATTGFADYAAENGFAIAWIDTAQSNFPVPPLWRRMARAAGRLIHFAHAAAAPASRGAILFAGAGASFVERSLMAIIARLFGKPVVLMIRSGHFQTHYRRSAIFRWLARWLLRIPARIGVQGESWVPFLEDAGVDRGRIVIVPNWLGHPAAAPRVRKLRSDRPVHLLFAGWMTAAKGLPELIEAARLLAAGRCDFVLTMAGGGDLLDQARAAASEPLLTGRLVVTGWLDREALGAAMEQADLLVLPSRAEGFPNVVMEALAAGLPVIATRVGAIPDSVTEGANGRLVPVGDAGAIADAVRSYRDTPGALASHSQAALATAARRHGRDANCRALLAALSLTPDDFGNISR